MPSTNKYPLLSYGEIETFKQQSDGNQDCTFHLPIIWTVFCMC